MRALLRVSLAPLVLLAGLTVAPAPAQAASSLRVGVIRTETSANAPYVERATYDGRVAVVVDVLNDEFASVELVDDATLSNTAALKRFDVLVAPGAVATTKAQRDAVVAYVAEGGGFVSSFGFSRWDYTRTRTWKPYEALITMMTAYPGSWERGRVWEWGEVSDFIQAKFANDPLTYSGYTVDVKPVATHPILAAAAARAGGSLDIPTTPNDPNYNAYNEIVWSMVGNPYAVCLATYQNARTDDANYPANGTMAGWAAPYGFGRSVYFGFKLHDLVNRGTTTAGNASARALLIESTRWAGTKSTFTANRKSVDLSGRAWFTRGKLYVNQTVKNTGTMPLRGMLRVTILDPHGTRILSAIAKNTELPLAPTNEYTLASWQPSVGVRPASGTWRVVTTYEWFDHFSGGLVTASRVFRVVSNGSSMSMGPFEPQTLTRRGSVEGTGTLLAGATRYETGVRLSQRGWPEGAGAEGAIVLATGTDYPDALAAAPLAAAMDAPLLLVPATGLGSAGAEIERLLAGHESARVVVVGGEGAVPAATADAAVAAAVRAGVESSGVNVERIAGPTRMATAANIAERVGVPATGPLAGCAILASGRGFADALAIAPVAARAGVPILLTERDAVPAATEAALRSLGVSHTVVVGGTAAVSTASEQWLEAQGFRVDGAVANSSSRDTRLSGADRYATALACVDFGMALEGIEAPEELYVTTGSNWPDALALAPVAAAGGTPVVLADGADLAGSVSVANRLIRWRDEPLDITFVGSVSGVTRGQVRAAIE